MHLPEAHERTFDCCLPRAVTSPPAGSSYLRAKHTILTIEVHCFYPLPATHDAGMPDFLDISPYGYFDRRRAGSETRY